MVAIRSIDAGMVARPGDLRFVHNHIAFDYQKARATRTAWEAFNERQASAATTRT